MNFRIKKIILISISITSFVLIILFIDSTNQSKGILIASLSAVLGASLSNVFALTGLNINGLINNSITLPKFLSGKNLDYSRKKYYAYAKTRDHFGYFWVHFVFDFRQNFSTTYLHGESIIRNEENKDLEYCDIGLIMDKRLITISPPKSNSKENPGTYIFPVHGKDFPHYTVGFGVIEDWTDTDLIAPIIISDKPIEKHKTLGRIKDDKVTDKLEFLAKESLPLSVLKNKITPPNER